jgi:hypothetical protein
MNEPAAFGGLRAELSAASSVRHRRRGAIDDEDRLDANHSGPPMICGGVSL